MAIGSDAAAHTASCLSVARTTEMSGVASGRGYVRGTGRTAHQPVVPRQRPPYITQVGALTSTSSLPGSVAGSLPGPVAGPLAGSLSGPQAKREDAEAAFTAYVQERRASLYATAYHLTG